MERLLPKRIMLLERVKKGVYKEKEHNVMPLSEASLNRMMEHGKTGMIIISSNRSEIDSDNPELSLRTQFEDYVDKIYDGMEVIDSDAQYDIEQEWLKKRNADADKQLKKDIMEAGFSFTPVYGGYKGKDGVSDEFEPSYVVYCYDRKGNLKDFQKLEDFAVNMCDKYGQESVYVQRPGEPPVYLDKDGNQVNSSSSLDFKFNRDDEPYFTTTNREKREAEWAPDKKTRVQRFTGDIVFENMYHTLRPADYNERMRRNKQGEYIL